MGIEHFTQPQSYTRFFKHTKKVFDMFCCLQCSLTIHTKVQIQVKYKITSYTCCCWEAAVSSIAFNTCQLLTPLCSSFPPRPPILLLLLLFPLFLLPLLPTLLQNYAFAQGIIQFPDAFNSWVVNLGTRIEVNSRNSI